MVPTKLYQLFTKLRAKQDRHKYMYIVYILISSKFHDRIHIGLTEDIAQRVDEHNASKSFCSRKYGPWDLVAYITFSQKKKASGFERYLKPGSGFAFLKKHLI